jgi:hypothetical protein
MNKLATLIAAVHASVLASSALTGPAMAQDSAEIKAYTNAVKTGTPAAIASFMKSYPKSTLPGSELGAKIAGSVGKPTGSVAATGGKAAASGTTTDSGRSGTDRDGGDLY